MNCGSRGLPIRSAVSIALFMFLGVALSAQGLPPSSELAQSSSQVEREKRQKRNALFDDHSQILPKLDQPLAPGEGYGESIGYRASLEPIPDREADTIVVGSVQKYQSFFSNDHTRIYTEFSFVPEQVLKGNIEVVYDVLVFGGAIKKGNGKIIEYHSGNPELLQLNARYVLFLRNDPENQIYRPIKQWGLADGHPTPINREDRQDALRGRSVIVKQSEADFLASIRNAISSH